MNDDVINEITSVLNDMQESLQAGADASSEIGTGLAELVEVLKKRTPDNSDKLAQAIRAIRITAPAVTVNPVINVSPTPIEVNLPEMKPVINIAPGSFANGARITCKYEVNGAIKEMTLLPLPK